MGHVVLLGDSIFDNRAYVGPEEPAVSDQVQAALPPGWKMTLLAVDGSVTRDVARQLDELPNDASHLVVSVGGNDALGHLSILTEGARSVAEVLGALADIGEEFERDYRAMLDAVLRRSLPTALCTIYYPAYPDANLQRLASAGLAVFNDVIIVQAARDGLPLLDLRLICNDPADYANPIEPSAKGGDKIARVIAGVVTGHDFSARRTVVYR
jgi:hypothetical protein